MDDKARRESSNPTRRTFLGSTGGAMAAMFSGMTLHAKSGEQAADFHVGIMTLEPRPADLRDEDGERQSQQDADPFHSGLETGCGGLVSGWN